MLLTKETIAAHLTHPALSCVYVGYSGGIDSHVLLHLCASIPELKSKIIAVYVHHGLQSAAEEWAIHAQKMAQELAVEFRVLRVNATAQLGESPEEAARNARYDALKALIQSDDVLLVAQHREDQLETVLLQLFRGAGLKGLSGMPETMAFGQGVLLRPLLNTPKQELIEYARQHQLQWVEDPSNAQNDYDRNFLRNAILPLLKQRWPALDKTVARSAVHCASADSVIEQIASQWFLAVFNKDDNTLLLPLLKQHVRQEQPYIIRAWFQYLGLKMPPQVFVNKVLLQVVGARQDSDPVLTGQGICIRRYRDKLYCLQPNSHTEWRDCAWPNNQTSVAIGNDRLLSCVPTLTGIALEQWRNARIFITFRGGGEKIALPNRAGRHSLKKLFQEAAIPPWQRAAIPLIYLDDRLAAVGDRWISAEFYQQNTPAVRLQLSHQSS